MSTTPRIPSYANYAALAANTPAAVGGGAGVRIGQVIVTATITGTVTLYDNPTAASGTVLFAVATPTAGAIYPIHVRAKTGCWCVPGTAGTVIVTWD